MEKDFDAVAWMRAKRTEIDREDQGLTWPERDRKTLEVLRHDLLWERLKGRLVATGSRSVPGGPEQESA